MIKQQNPACSLYNVMHDLFKVSSEQAFSTKLFKDIVYKYIKGGIDSEILNFIDQGHIIPLEDVSLPIEKVLMSRYYLGFNEDMAWESSIIQNLDARSNAFKVGLRNGQKIIGHDIPIGKRNPNQIITVKITGGTFQFKLEHYDAVYQLKTNLSGNGKQRFNEFFGIQK